MTSYKKASPDIKRLRELLSYSPTDGTFTWKKSLGTRSLAGTFAGGIDTNGYVRISFDKEIYPAHRLAWFYIHGTWPGTITHLNGVRTDNRLENLRASIADPETRYRDTPKIVTGRLREVLDYNAETGVFLWKVATSSRNAVGSPAGAINNVGYRVICVDGKNYLAHRLAWLYVHGVWPEHEIDHINRDRADNRLINLRQATKSQNMVNGNTRSDNKSGYKGVTWHKGSQKWRAVVQKDGKQYQIGMFTDIEEAAKAYAEFAAKLHGEFAETVQDTNSKDASAPEEHPGTLAPQTGPADTARIVGRNLVQEEGLNDGLHNIHGPS
jgi:hypothetical protein